MTEQNAEITPETLAGLLTAPVELGQALMLKECYDRLTAAAAPPGIRIGPDLRCRLPHPGRRQPARIRQDEPDADGKLQEVAAERTKAEADRSVPGRGHLGRKAGQTRNRGGLSGVSEPGGGSLPARPPRPKRRRKAPQENPSITS